MVDINCLYSLIYTLLSVFNFFSSREYGKEKILLLGRFSEDTPLSVTVILQSLFLCTWILSVVASVTLREVEMF